MNNLDHLQEITERILQGIRADQSLKFRILSKAVSANEKSSVVEKRRLVPAALSVIAVMIAGIMLLNGKMQLPAANQTIINSFSAGSDSRQTLPSFSSFAETDPDAVLSFSLSDKGLIDSIEESELLFSSITEDSVPAGITPSKLEYSLIIRLKSGIEYCLPADEPYIAFADGVRRCDRFFALFGKAVH